MDHFINRVICKNDKDIRSVFEFRKEFESIRKDMDSRTKSFNITVASLSKYLKRLLCSLNNCSYG